MAKHSYITSSFFFLSLLSLSSSTSTLNDVITPSPVLPTTSPPATFPPVTIIPTNPVTTFPSTPPATPLPLNPPVTTIPATLTPPVSNPVSNPVSFPATNPFTNPVTTPVTNPVTQYPPTQSGTNPVVVAPPVLLPPPPVVSNSPSVTGQSWCVAKPGAAQMALQQALDYACGLGGVDCSQIQQSGNCYSPVSLQNHASFAFNSYYQKNPSPQSCDFGGAAGLVTTNPSTGSCIYQTGTGAGTGVGTTTPTPSTQTVNQPATSTPMVPVGGGIIGVGTPPAIFNPANPSSNTLNSPSSGSAYGFDGSPNGNTPTSSHSTHLHLHFGHYIVVVTFILQALLFH